MKNKSDAKKQAALSAQAAASQLAANTALGVASTPTHLEDSSIKELQDWKDYTSGKNGPPDLTKAPGMGVDFGLYQNAIAQQDAERDNPNQGIGALRLGTYGSDPTAVSQLAQQIKDARQQQAAGKFENAYHMKDAQMRGDVLSFLNFGQRRQLSIADMRNNAALDYSRQNAGFQTRPSVFANVLGQGFGALGQIGAAYAGRDRNP